MMRIGTLVSLAATALALALALQIGPAAAQGAGAPGDGAPKQNDAQKESAQGASSPGSPKQTGLPKEPAQGATPPGSSKQNGTQKNGGQDAPGSGAPKLTDLQKRAADAETARKTAENLAAAEKKEQEAQRTKAQRERTSSYEGKFSTEDLAGGYRAGNELQVSLPVSELHSVTIEKFSWKDADRPNCRQQPNENVTVRSRLPHPETEKASTTTVIAIEVPVPPCWWPIYQEADLKLTALVGADREKTKTLPLFEGPVRVSVFWFPFLVTLMAVLLVYPGSAMTSYYANWLRYRRQSIDAARAGKPLPNAPKFWESLDPVELTKNAFGRGSVSKLQIYFFTILVFAILLFHLLRTGNIANMSADVLMLLGISAVGAAGGKLVSKQRRRLSMNNWAWLQRKEWLPENDIQPRAKWSELFLDESKEFDPYTFQMAIFSVVVAVALVRTNLNGLGTFKIPAELLALLGISQVVFIGGRAIDGSSHTELEKKLEEVRTHESKYSELILKADAAPTTAPADHKPPVTRDEFKAEAEKERQAFKREIEQAGTIFWGIYGEQIVERPKALGKLSEAEPEVYRPL